eukprot:4518714-Prymnesium_polylepis.1
MGTRPSHPTVGPRRGAPARGPGRPSDERATPHALWRAAARVSAGERSARCARSGPRTPPRPGALA